MQVSKYKGPTPEAFRGFLEGVQYLRDYLVSNEGEKLISAERQLTESLNRYPDFAPAKYYKAIVLTHERKAEGAITLLEELRQSKLRFKAEVLYNLAFAYARKYTYDDLKRALELLTESEYSAHRRFAGRSFGTKRPDLVLLILAMKAWVMSVFGGRTCGHKADFTARRLEYLPKSLLTAQSVLSDRRLEPLPPDTKWAIKMEAHNASGIAYMRMGQYADLFKKDITGTANLEFKGDRSSDLYGMSDDEYWKLAEQHFSSALNVHPRDVRVLDNLSTLNLIRACHAFIQGDKATARKFSGEAKERVQTSISYNRNDSFRFYNLAKALALLDEWDAATQALADLVTVPGVPNEEEATQFEEEVIRPRDKRPILKYYYYDDVPNDLTAEQLRN